MMTRLRNQTVAYGETTIKINSHLKYSTLKVPLKWYEHYEEMKQKTLHKFFKKEYQGSNHQPETKEVNIT